VLVRSGAELVAPRAAAGWAVPRERGGLPRHRRAANRPPDRCVRSARRYGRVYRGKYKGQEVAVKVIQDVSRVRMINGAPVLSWSQ